MPADRALRDHSDRGRQILWSEQGFPVQVDAVEHQSEDVGEVANDSLPVVVDLSGSDAGGHVPIRLPEPHRFVQHIPDRVGLVQVDGVLVHPVGIDRTRTGQQCRGDVETDETRLGTGGIERGVALPDRSVHSFLPLAWCGCRIHHRDRRDRDDVDARLQIPDDIGNGLCLAPNSSGAVENAVRLERHDFVGIIGRRYPDVGTAGKSTRVHACLVRRRHFEPDEFEGRVVDDRSERLRTSQAGADMHDTM